MMADASDYDEFVQAVMATMTGANRERASADVAAYFDPSMPYTGSKFEVLANLHRADEVTANDIVAVSTLSVTIPAGVAVWLLSEEGRLTISSILVNVPANVDLWDRPDLLKPDGDLWRLWHVLAEANWPTPTTGNGMGTTKTSKLLAVKRPRLVPVFDSVVRDALPKVDSHWAAFAAVVADRKRREVILDVTSSAPPRVSLLRRLDVVLWMANRRGS
jgi:hypothetical protein